MNQIYDLAYYFTVNVLRKPEHNTARIHNACQSIQNLCGVGWTLDALKAEIDAFQRDYPSLLANIYHLEEVIGNKKPPNNLIEEDVFYYHNHLRITSSPSKLVLNKETRQYERVEEEFFLEMKAFFTIEDLLKYWYESNGMRSTNHHIKQDTGRFKYLLDFYDIDEVLFMIDIAQQQRALFDLRPLTNAFQLEKYVEDARKKIKEKQNIHLLKGINHVIPRKVV
ncbi:hypothetical protein [Oceanobacillus profundus]|uniref:Uncharacterized protein n=1 Tax=Oceanobacillus profundus TaxID=372463 RepID=A0A417YGW1_9BACI|nr:hypothetical protein [Oceanobacillus profundus]RHW32025.1 hypothetical protein D1B32_12380 [Oceanobacillus profundus]